MLKGERGSILIEFLVAVVIFSLVSAAVSKTFAEGVKIFNLIKERRFQKDPIQVALSYLEKDLRSTIILRKYPFKGSEKEIFFPVLKYSITSPGEKEKKLFLIHYYFKNKALFRSEKEIKDSFYFSKEKTKKFFENLSDLTFAFPYEDKNGQKDFKNFWLDEPYYGIPRCVVADFSFKSKNQNVSKLIAIPQGRMAQMSVEVAEV